MQHVAENYAIKHAAKCILRHIGYKLQVQSACEAGN